MREHERATGVAARACGRVAPPRGTGHQGAARTSGAQGACGGRDGIYESGAGRAERGQSTLEYALVLLAMLSIVVALGALWHAGRDGTLLRLATRSASHALETERAVASAQDVLLY